MTLLSKSTEPDSINLTAWTKLCNFLLLFSPFFLISSFREICSLFDFIMSRHIRYISINEFHRIFFPSIAFLGALVIPLISFYILQYNLYKNNHDSLSLKITEASLLSVDCKKFISTICLVTIILGSFVQITHLTVYIVFIVIGILFLFYRNSLVIFIPLIIMKRLALYEISYIKGNLIKKGWLLSPEKNIEKHNNLKVHPLGKRYFHHF